jgi:hypothetical protein
MMSLFVFEVILAVIVQIHVQLALFKLECDRNGGTHHDDHEVAKESRGYRADCVGREVLI